MSIAKEVDRKVSRKEIDRVLREWAELKVLGQRAVACVSRLMPGDFIVMPTSEYDAYTEAVTMARFPEYAWSGDEVKPELICGMEVIIDDSVSELSVYSKKGLPKKYVTTKKGRDE